MSDVWITTTIFWRKSDTTLPDSSRIVLVAGGVAQYRNGKWYTQTGLDSGREIEWPVEWWAEIPRSPQLDENGMGVEEPNINEPEDER